MTARRKTEASRRALANAIEGPCRSTTRQLIGATDNAQSEAKARERMHGWLETYGHSAVSHGFEFVETNKAVPRRKLGMLAALERHIGRMK